MATWWLDFQTGNDGNTGVNPLDVPPGSGPKKTLNAYTSPGVSPGDAINVLEGPANTALAGTLSWTDGSTAVVTSVDHSATGTGLLAVGDFIGKPFASPLPPGSVETWWEITSIVGVNITLRAVYAGTTEVVAGCEKLGVIVINQTQLCTCSGSLGSLVTISGGWNSGTGLRTGQTWWCSSAHNTYTGIDENGQGYVKIEHLGILRFQYQVWCDGWTAASWGWELDNVTLNGGSYGVYLRYADDWEISNFCCSQNNTVGIYAWDSPNNINIHDGVVYNTVAQAISITNYCLDPVVQNITIRHCVIGLNFDLCCERAVIDSVNVQKYTSKAFALTAMWWGNVTNISGSNSGNNSYFLSMTNCKQLEVEGMVSSMSGLTNTNHIHFGEYSSGIRVTNAASTGGARGVYALAWGKNCVISDMSLDTVTIGIYMETRTGPLVVNKYRPTGVATDVDFAAPGSADNKSDLPILRCNSFKVAGQHRSYFEGESGGVISTMESDTAEALAGTCVKVTPKDTKFWMKTDFMKCGALAGVDKTLKVSMKEDAGSAFSGAGGEIEMAAYFNGERISGWTAQAISASYVEKSILAPGASIYEDGVLELVARIKGTAGNVYLDTFATS